MLQVVHAKLVRCEREWIMSQCAQTHKKDPIVHSTHTTYGHFAPL